MLTYTLLAMPSQMIAGFIADKFPKPPILTVILVIQTGSLVVIAVSDSVATAFLFAILYGISIGGRIPLMTAIRGDYFGRKAFATIMGLSQFPNNLTMIGAPLFAGYMYDVRGSYFIPFITFAVICGVGAVLMTFVRRPRLTVASAAQQSPRQ